MTIVRVRFLHIWQCVTFGIQTSTSFGYLLREFSSGSFATVKYRGKSGEIVQQQLVIGRSHIHCMRDFWKILSLSRFVPFQMK